MILYLQKINQREYGLSASEGGSDRNISEALLKDLVKAPEITIVFPPELTEAEARNIFISLIDAQVKKHRRWMLANGALLPFSIPLTIIPGPNVVLFYIAWRRHFRITNRKRRTKSTQRNAAEIRSRKLWKITGCTSSVIIFPTIKNPATFHVNRFR